MPELRASQFQHVAERTNESPGGISLNLNTGKEPKSGIMVAQAGHERTLSIPTTAEHVASYAADKAGPLSEPGAHLGTWHPKGSTSAAADVSRRFPSSQRRSAMRETVMNKEKAAYDVSSGDDINNPLHPANADTSGMSHAQAKAHVAATRAAHDVFAEGYRKQQGRAPLSVRKSSRKWSFTPKA
jgi:hypothetical protein